MRRVAVLFCDPKGSYSKVRNVDLWDASRDARTYAGPYPVIAHPPCSRWCQLAGLIQHRYGHKKGDDGGCFASALKSVREYGGVLEHPAYSLAWEAHGLPRPHRHGGWREVDGGGYTCHVEQGFYGHPCRKAKWLYASKVMLRGLRWGRFTEATHSVSLLTNNGGQPLPRLSGRKAQATPPEFRNLLLRIARSAYEW